MDSDILRLVLFILGIAFVAGIYFWDKRKHVDSRLSRKQASRKADRHDISVFDQVEHREPIIDPSVESDFSPEPEVLAETKNEPVDDIESKYDEPVSEQLSFSAEPDDVSIDDDSLSFSSTDAFQEFEAGADLPTKILQVNLVMRKGEISGQMILDLTSELDLELGEFNIFHRMDKKTGKSIFSMANIVEPGSFDKTSMDSFTTPGLTLFSQLPAPIDCVKVYADMIDVAKRIRYIVGAELQDASHSVMTAQSIEHEREAVVQYKHKLQLAMQSL